MSRFTMPRAEIVGNDGSAPDARIRASSFSTLMDCAYRWEGEQIMGLSRPSGMAAHLGSAIHAGTEAFDAGTLRGAAPVSITQAVDAFVDALWHPAYEIDFSRDRMTLRDAEYVGTQLVSRYCRDVSPLFEFTSVEAMLEPIRVNVDGVLIELTGRLDRTRLLRFADGSTGDVIADVKTGAMVVQGGRASIKGRSGQLAVYQLMHEVNRPGTSIEGGQIIALPTRGSPEPAVSPVFPVMHVLAGTDNAPGLLDVAAAMLSSGLFPPNPGSALCSERYCPRWDTCHFHEPSGVDD